MSTRLVGSGGIDGSEFAAYGLDVPSIAALRRWAQEWADDIAERLLDREEPTRD
ncbi:hypothetical protein [Streptomyces sp. BBFR102]|uniref:hypothetical protein n=1 Tax=Streptomyces sp. BBFR102 TaxID=3448171 RepID=UPI003F53D328